MKVKKRSVASELAASPRSSGERQTVARVNLRPEVAAIIIKTQSGSTCGNTEFLEIRCCLTKCFEKN